MRTEPLVTAEETTSSDERAGSDRITEVRADRVFHCPNGCGPMLARKCKLSCTKCGYYDSCSDFC